MSSKLVEILILGQVLRLNVPVEQEESLRQAARNLESQVAEVKERTKLLQLDRVLSIVALNLSFELMQQKNKNEQIENVLKTRIQQLDHSLESILSTKV
ncbi:cell division protein ZapA [Rodentibacter caecimuris]|uniref:Cell division protein ZapA n=1 Tax=Rodentibacter caecimuris TaxID=1796644 RepID=A0ABX3KZI1_9PAST|nr:cell division protein ZapA [Rodentibacter heylii]